jgi:hypothetical protein
LAIGEQIREQWRGKQTNRPINECRKKGRGSTEIQASRQTDYYLKGGKMETIIKSQTDRQTVRHADG